MESFKPFSISHFSHQSLGSMQKQVSMMGEGRQKKDRSFDLPRFDFG